MASERVLDIDNLCAPISEDQPVGPYWRDDEDCRDSLYPNVDSAMRDARTNERKRIEMLLFPEGSIERRRYDDPDWGAVIEAAKPLLLKSKDLWVASWLSEALAREFGFAGLRDGLILLRNLCETYWDQIHPRPDEMDGIRHTLAQMDGDIWANLVPLMPITKSGHSTADYDRSTEMEGLDSENDRDTYRAMGVISTADFESAVAESGAEYLKDLIDDANAAFAEFTALTAFLDERCGMDAPASTRVKECFEQCLDLIRVLGAPWLPAEDLVVAGEGADDGSQTDQANGDRDEKQSGWSREVAFKEIGRQADLFDKHEPNSPVASILRQAVHLGRLPWREMIAGLTDDESTLKQILKQTGIPGNLNEDDQS